MFVRPSIREVPNDTEGVYAFHIMGEVGADDMSAMGAYMNERFDRHDSVSMLLIFDRYDGSERGASLDWEVIKSQVRSLSKVDKYAVVGAPDRAAKMVETFGSVIPVETRAFDTAAEGWSFVGARAEDADLHN